MQMKNIAVLVSSLKSGGAERIAGLLSMYLADKYNVYVFTGNTKDIVYDYAGTVIDYSVYGEENIYESVRKLKSEYDIDCAISFDHAMNLVNIMTKCNESVIITHHISIGERNSYPYRTSVKIKRLYGYADKIISVSHGATNELIRDFNIDKSKIATIYNFIDKQTIITKADEQLPSNVSSFIGTSKMILNVGRLDKQKNQKKLLVQFSKICNEYDVKLVILGSGEMEAELKETANILGINKNTMFLPYCSNPFPYYKKASLFVLSSDYEGFGLVIIEAMLNHIPCVCVDCLSGPREIMANSVDYNIRAQGFEICERGILVEKCDTDTTGKTSHLANAIKTLLDNDKLRNSIITQSDIYMKQYSNDMILSQWIDVIENTVSSKEVYSSKYPELNGINKVIVYGAGFLGKLTMAQLFEMDRSFDLMCFAVSDKNIFVESEVMGYPVYELSELLQYKDDAIVFVGITDIHGGENAAIENLIKYGFNFTFADIPINYY